MHEPFPQGRDRPWATSRRGSLINNHCTIYCLIVIVMYGPKLDKTISIVQEVSNYSFDVGDLVEIITTKGKTRVSPTNLK